MVVGRPQRPPGRSESGSQGRGRHRRDRRRRRRRHREHPPRGQEPARGFVPESDSLRVVNQAEEVRIPQQIRAARGGAELEAAPLRVAQQERPLRVRGADPAAALGVAEQGGQAGRRRGQGVEPGPAEGAGRARPQRRRRRRQLQAAHPEREQRVDEAEAQERHAGALHQAAPHRGGHQGLRQAALARQPIAAPAQQERWGREKVAAHQFSRSQLVADHQYFS